MAELPGSVVTLQGATPPARAQPTVVNGLAAEEPPGQWYFPTLQAGVTATGSDATAIAATVQASPGEDVLRASSTLPATAPAGCRQVVFDGLAFAAPASWPIDNPAEVVADHWEGRTRTSSWAWTPTGR